MINELFDLMDKWRNHPNWQLERRADIFFALCLEKTLATTGWAGIVAGETTEIK